MIYKRSNLISKYKNLIHKKFNLILKEGTYIEYDGFSGYINDYGYMDIPVKYNKFDDLEKRDNENIIVILRNINNYFSQYFENTYNTPSLGDDEGWIQYYNNHYVNSIIRQKKASLSLSILEDFGYQYSPLYYSIMEDLESASFDCREYREKTKRLADNYAFSQKVDSFVEAFTNTISTLTGNNTEYEGNAAEYDFSDIDNSTSKTGNIIRKPKDDSSENNLNSIAEQNSYNRDKSTYARYDGMLSEAFAGNRNASASEIKSWQSKMKRLRQKWEKKGKDFPHFANEDK